MIVNGQYVDYDEKKIADIQRDINKSNDLKNDLKSEVKNPRDVLDDGNIGMDFGKFSLFDVEGADSAERQSFYDYYREMVNMEFIHRALEIVADDSTQSNNDGDVIKILSDDEGNKDLIEDLLLHRLDLNNELWSIFYDTAKMGDNFFEIVPDNYDNPKKIIYLRYLQPNRVKRVEIDGKLSHFEYTPDPKKDVTDHRGHTKTEEMTGEYKVYRLQPWQVVHFKVHTDRDVDPYGASLLKPAIRTYRRLSLLEDVILVYRISRAPERRVFKIDVGNMNAVDAKKFLQKIKNSYRTQNFIDENGNINKKANVLSITSDIFVPVREGGRGTEVSTLQGGEALKSLEDLDYFKDKILRVMNIPPAYLGEGADRSRGSLSQQDIKFSRFIERIQAQIVKGLNKIVALELFFSGAKKENLSDFKLEMTPPSNIKELTEIDLINQRMSLIGAVQGLNIYSTDWILRNIMHHSDREIQDIKMQKTLEMQAQQQQGGAEGMGGFGGEMGGGMAGGLEGGLGGEPAPIGGEAPAPAGGEAPAPLAASTMVDLFGQDFLVENKEDFLTIAKAAKEYLKEQTREPSMPPLIENIVEIFNRPIRETKSESTSKDLRRQFILNEMGGLVIPNGKIKERAIKLYESYKSLNEDKKEITKYKEKTILLS